ncbi:MAG: hypothetical protein F6J89_04600 [Symploca sp. SIO1C4]|uniref:Uncharacterized protein n=1 Tax=Symploca sp. SIO1C4 TaxID=2607765 RepID=A0A6B3NA18_9CYAN|nr:hypothetical protein [Symploca sp. SIO1C4]
MAHGSWLMAHGSWLMAHGSWLMAHGSLGLYTTNVEYKPNEQSTMNYEHSFPMNNQQ